MRSTQRTFSLLARGSSLYTFNNYEVPDMHGIYYHLLSLNFFSPQQHSFRNGHFYITKLLTAVNTWATILDGKGKVDVIYLDFSKALIGTTICVLSMSSNDWVSNHLELIGSLHI